MAKTITAKIPLKGISKGERKPVFETDGFTGTACQSATEAFENAIGSVEEETLKNEYYDTEERNEFLSNDGE